MARKKQKWQVGDYFGIPIEDDFLAVGQILGKYDWIGVACLITKIKISSKNLPLYEDIQIDKNDVIAAMFITEDALDKGFWPIIQQGIVNKNILKQYFPNIVLIIVFRLVRDVVANHKTTRYAGAATKVIQKNHLA